MTKTFEEHLLPYSTPQDGCLVNVYSINKTNHLQPVVDARASKREGKVDLDLCIEIFSPSMQVNAHPSCLIGSRVGRNIELIV